MAQTLFNHRFVRFALVGTGFAALNLGLLCLLVERMGLPYLWACLTSFFALNFLSYGLNKVVTFRRSAHIEASELLVYYLVMAFSLAANLLLMYLFVTIMGLHYLLASLVVTTAFVVVNYFGHSRITFRERPRPASNRAPRVLQVSAFFPAHGGGIEVVAGRLAEAISATGTEVHWMAGGDAGDVPMYPASGLRVLHAASIDLLESYVGLPVPIWGPRSMRRLWQEVRRADIVHVHDFLYLSSLAAMLFAAMVRKPVVLTQHIGEIPFRSGLWRRLLQVLNLTIGRFALRRADQVVFVGQPVMDYFSVFVRYRRPPLLVANGVDHRRYYPVPRCETAPRDVELLFVGRFVEKKGINLLRRCVDLPGTHWTFIGWGPLTPAGWVHLPPNVTVLNHLRAEDVVPHYQQADLLVLPSIGEGFPLVVQESLACATPVVVSSEVAKAFPASDSRCVFEVDLAGPDPEAALRARIESLIAEPGRLHSGRDFAQALAGQWSWDACVSEYKAIYSHLRGSALPMP